MGILVGLCDKIYKVYHDQHQDKCRYDIMYSIYVALFCVCGVMCSKTYTSTDDYDYDGERRGPEVFFTDNSKLYALVWKVPAFFKIWKKFLS